MKQLYLQAGSHLQAWHIEANMLEDAVEIIRGHTKFRAAGGSGS